FEFTFGQLNLEVTATPEYQGCAPFTVEFIDGSAGVVEYFWDFGDGTTSTESDPVHTYEDPGSYVVTLIGYNPDYCIPYDTLTLDFIDVFDLPTAGFIFTPDPPSLFQEVDFTDASLNETTWFWTFGDGAISTEENPSHQYATPGNYKVCLVVENAAGCQDSICDSIEVLEVSLFDSPNAFSPNGDGVNDFYIPVSFGLQSFEIFIYNRWGEMVFYSNDIDFNWDGKFNDVEQGMDTYVYIVNGLGKDGVSYYKQGNITLVR
ncbi:MAG: PKD domain-containing protein, partial [Chitinophagales bacterium]|nr:PKD domain-containing protein [Chitinophagales bacterium]